MPMSTRVESGYDTLIKGKSHKNDVSPVRVSRTFTSHGNKQSLANVESIIDYKGSNNLTWGEGRILKSSRFMSVFAAFFLIGLGGCVGSSTPPTSHGGPVQDYVSLIDHLRAASVTVVPTGTVAQPSFSVTGQIITVNGEQVQVYEYANDDGANTDAARISPDGGTIGNSMVDWIAPPHFYKVGQLIVLYVGTSKTVINILETTLGTQFAGR
jgi:hypothetical protein